MYITDPIVDLGHIESVSYLKLENTEEIISYPRQVKTLYIRSWNGNNLWLPHNLEKFVCRRSTFTSLPELPTSLKTLDCAYNDLNSLPELPEGLINLICDHNKLTSLPKLPEGLEELLCNDNKLTSLPELPSSLRILFCDKNNIEELPTLPDSLFNIEVDKKLQPHYSIPVAVYLKLLQKNNKLENENREYKKLQELDIGNIIYQTGKKYI